MAENSNIEWTTHTLNPWLGCTKVSPACDFCYAENWAKRAGRPELWNGARQRSKPVNWAKPLKWDRAAAAAGVRHRVFCASLADVFDNQVPEQWRADLWDLIARCRTLDWLLLTKRPQNIAKMLPAFWPWPHVWLGTTAENQVEYQRRWPHLAAVPAVVRFISGEPLFSKITLTASEGLMPDWIIAGGEDFVRPGRETPAGAFEYMRDQCRAAGIPFFMKQMNGKTPIPPDLMVRQYPIARAA